MYTALFAVAGIALLLCICGAVSDLRYLERQRKPKRITVAEWLKSHSI